MVDLLQVIGNGKARFPAERKNRKLQISSPWFLNRVLEIYGSRTADVTLRRAACRVLYDLTLDDVSKAQLIEE